MSSRIHQLLTTCLFVAVSIGSAFGTPSGKQARKAIRMVTKNSALPDNIQQLIVVFTATPESSTAVLVPLEKTQKEWKVVSAPWEVRIGRKGFASPNAKREGDNCSPTGLFGLGELFCYEKVVNTKMPYLQTTPEDKWIDDPDSEDYNRHVRGATTAKSHENLKLRSDEYKYCMAIEYNMHPVVKGFGSAIFIHLLDEKSPGPTAGCIVMHEQEMEKLLKWMDPKFKPSILMGTEKILMSGIQ